MKTRTYTVRIGIPALAWFNTTLLVDEENVDKNKLNFETKLVDLANDLRKELSEDEIEYEIELIEHSGMDYSVVEEKIN
jgi:hypothetical protein